MGINRLSASLLALLFSEHGAAEPAQVELYGHIEANYRIFEKAERDFRALHDRGQLSPSESEDYEAYLNRLRNRLSRDCTLLLQATGISKPLPVACKEYAGIDNLPASTQPETLQTDEEQTATLDAELGTLQPVLAGERAGFIPFEQILI